MSLFIDVIEPLSNRIKKNLMQVIENERRNQDRPVRKISDTCIKYLDYGELRYDKMEDGISDLQKAGISSDSFSMMLLAILNESLDEDQKAIDYFTRFSRTSLAADFRPDLEDFITIGKFATLREFGLLGTAGEMIIDKYTSVEDVSDTLSNMYLKIDNEEYLPVFQRLVDRAKTLYPESLPLETLNGFINLKAKDYPKALDSFLHMKDHLEADKESRYYNYNLAVTWDSIAGCYLKMGDGPGTMESCDTALGYDNQSEESKVGNPILYKKAEAYILLGDNTSALTILDEILSENSTDETALEIKKKIGGS
jgi:tetratricopeptide (TPR) repeat protein